MTTSTLLKKYSEYLLEHGKRPVTIYAFAKQAKIEESAFYGHFASFDHMEATFFTHWFDATLKACSKVKGFEEYASRDKLLTFYFGFFEQLTANRSLVLLLLEENGLKNKLSHLKKLRSKFLDFFNSLDFPSADLPIEELNKYKNKALGEGAWAQFLFILKYWMKDESPSFEKTDVLIEKSIDTGFSLIASSPLDKVLDLGKFLVKDHF